MIIYFADRHFNILGLASSNLQNGLHIVNDTKSESIESGVKTFECELTFDENSRAGLENCTEAGNFVLRSQDDENEFYTIIETTIDILNSSIVVYCEDAGLDMINDVAAAAAAPDTAQGVDYYISRYTANSGFQIGTNEISGLKRTLSWDGESTAAERIRSIANQFNNAEIGFSFDIKGLFIETKYINIYKKRGDDRGVTLRLGHEINNITISKSVANLASALFVKGGQDSAGKTITLKGYEYDDGDIYSPRDSAYLYCRSANAKWSRKNWEQISGSGWLTKQYSYETTSQSTLCSHAVTELKKLKDTEINYEIEISDFNNKQIEIGDTIYIVDDQGELYLSARVLELETSITNSSMTATLGDYLIKNSGINDKVLQLANDFQNIVNNLENAQQTPVLQIESSNGLIFKTGIETTALNVTIYRGNAQIKDISELRATFGETAQLIWSYLSDSVYVQIPATDSRLSNDAFTLTVSSADVTEKLTFKCEVVIDGETVEIVAANQVTLAKVADGEGMSEEQIAQLNQASADATQAKTDASAAKSTANSAQTAAESAETKANAAQTAAEAAQVDIDETQTYFYHDPVGGAHVLGNNYRTDVKDGLQIVRVADNMPLASFEEKLVKIGEDSVDAEVQLCGGSGHISYDKAKHRFLITNKMDANESIAIETNFDSGGSEPYALMDLYRHTQQETAKFELEASSGDDGKEVFILGSVSGNTSGAGINRLNLQARDIQIGTDKFLEPTLKVLAQNIDIGLERSIYHEYPTVIWVHGQMILDDEQEIWIGDGKVCTGEFLEIYGSNGYSTTRTLSNADTYYGAHSGGNWTYRTQNGVRGVVPYWASVPESSATGKITITKSGTYRIDYQIYLYTGFTAGDRIAVGILKNYLSTSSTGASNERVAYARVQNAAAYLTVGGYCLVECEEGDDLRLAAKNITAGRGTISLSAISKMLITRVGI